MSPPPGSEKNRRYLADLARRSDVRAAINPKSRSGPDTRQSQSTLDATSPTSHSDGKSERARRLSITRARAARNNPRGPVKSRLGAVPTVRDQRRPGSNLRSMPGGTRSSSSGPRAAHGRGSNPSRASQASKPTLADLDSELDAYMEEGAKKAGQAS